MSEKASTPYAVNYDLSNCDAEPIHLIRHFQLPAFLLVIEGAEFVVVACSENVPLPSGAEAETVMGQKLDELLDEETCGVLRRAVSAGEFGSVNPLRVNIATTKSEDEGDWNLIVRPSGKYYLLEFEPRDADVSTTAFLNRMDLTLQRIQAGGNDSDLFDQVTSNVRQLTGYDRVMLYRFDEKYNGEVIAEAKEASLPAFLHLRYPHTDIPSQARDLFLRNHVRHIVSTAPDEVSAIKFSSGLRELDLSLSANRGASPIHLEYLRNMEVGASLTISVVVNQKLWGLIACHHRSTKLVDYRLRSMISLVGKILSGHMALKQATDFRQRILGTKLIRSRLFERMISEHDIVGGLIDDQEEGLLKVTGGTGAALLFDGDLYRVGECPAEDELNIVVDWLGEKEDSTFITNTLFEELPEAKNFSTSPAGLMAIRLSQSPGEYILWFRPEVTRTIKWGGKPEQRKNLDGGRVRLHPNLSFNLWEQKLAGTANAWEDHHKDAAFSLRNDIKEVILRKYQEIRRLNSHLVEAYEELESFSYSVSHDLRAPLRNIKGFAEILYEDYYGELSADGKLAIDTILSSVGRMNQFINDILMFSRLGRIEPSFTSVNLAELTEEIWEQLKFEAVNFSYTADIQDAVITGDRIQLRQLVQNLLSNAVKYSRKQERPSVSVHGRRAGDKVTYVVTDNGIGMDMKHAGKVFTVFSRLVSNDQYEGTGIGLAVVKRVVDKHAGSISLQSSPGEGATFTVTFPVDFKVENQG